MGRGFWLFAGVGAAAAGGLFVARRRLVAIRVTGTSMSPAFNPGDRVLVRRTDGGGVRRGQVVVLQIRPPGRPWRTTPLPRPQDQMWFLKRVSAVAGDPVPAEVAEALGEPEAAMVPAGSVVVRGDGPVSEDSRKWGYVPYDRVLGVVVSRLWTGESDEPR